MTYSVQLYDQVTDQKLEIIHINNTIDLDDNDDNFTELFEQELLDPKLKETKYNIKKSDFYQYHQNAWYLAPEDNGIVTHTRYNLGELKVANDGTGYLKSNIIPNDMLFPFRPWGSTENYDFIFTFTMTDYLINNNTVKFDLYYVSCTNDTTFFTSTFDIVTTTSNNRIKLEQEYNGNYYNRSISYELENTLNGNIQFLAEEKYK